MLYLHSHTLLETSFKIINICNAPSSPGACSQRTPQPSTNQVLPLPVLATPRDPQEAGHLISTFNRYDHIYFICCSNMLDPTKAMGHRSWLTLCYTNIAIETGRLKLIYQLTIVIFQFANGTLPEIKYCFSHPMFGAHKFRSPEDLCPAALWPAQVNCTAISMAWVSDREATGFPPSFSGFTPGYLLAISHSYGKKIMFFCR